MRFSPVRQRNCVNTPALDLALLLQHADAFAQRGQGVFELGLAMGRRDDAARAAVEVDPAGHHRRPAARHVELTRPGPVIAAACDGP